MAQVSFQGSTTCAEGKGLRGLEKPLGYCYVQHLLNFFNLLLAVNKHATLPAYAPQITARTNIYTMFMAAARKESFSQVCSLILKEIHVNWSKNVENEKYFP